MVFRVYSITLLLIYFFGSTQPLQAAQLSDSALFYRCYSHLTNRAPSLDHALWSQVKAGTKTAVDACSEILSWANLSEAGGNLGILAAPSLEALWVLETMHDVHRSWFGNDDLVTSVPFGQEYYRFTNTLHDETEGALHITRALFSSGVDYSEISNGTDAVEAIRTDGPQLNMLVQTCDSCTTPAILNVEQVQTGRLIGVKLIALNPSKSAALAHKGDQVNDLGVVVGPLPGQSVNGSLGGGIIGTRSYMTLNIGRPNQLPSDGGIIMNRRWSKAVLKDLLCRDLPAIRIGDATSYIQTKTSLDTPPFRTGSTCMQCHASMDTMAGTIRNISLGFIPFKASTSAIGHASIWPVTAPTPVEPVDKDPNFYKSPPDGRFVFRSYDGTLSDRAVASVSDLGDQISQTKDLFVCAAARYFEFFTGITPNLQDQGDVNSDTLSTQAQIYRDEVIKHGVAFKQHQNQQTLIKDIISSSIYRSEDLR